MRQIRTHREWGETGRLELDSPPRHRGELTPGDMYHGRQRAILSRQEKIK